MRNVFDNDRKDLHFQAELEKLLRETWKNKPAMKAALESMVDDWGIEIKRLEIKEFGDLEVVILCEALLRFPVDLKASPCKHCKRIEVE